jgi:hypothetical protein
MDMPFSGQPSGLAFLALASCLASEPAPPRAVPPPALTHVPPPAVHGVVRVRVLGARWRGLLPVDESGPWSLGDAHLIVDNLNVSASETGLSFVLESAAALDVVDELHAQVPATRAQATAAMDSFAASGRVSNQLLTVVVARVRTDSWVSGWGQQGHPLGTAGKWPIIIVNTRVARSRQAHWIGHELGHVLGFYDTTFYEASPVDNAPYTQCGLFLPSRTFPRGMAPAGARQNLMSYDPDERRSYFSAGYEIAHRQILDCWVRSSGL